MTLVLILGAAIGAIMGLTGAGGGILAVPVLVVGMHWTMQQAAPVALFAVASGAAVGALDGFRHRLVRYKAATLMAICGVPMTRVGQSLAQEMAQYLLLGVFSSLMMMVAWRFYKQSLQKELATDDDKLQFVLVNDNTGRFIWTPVSASILASIGLLTGLMTGLLGVGGGFLIVPLMKRFTKLSLAGIVATSLFVITLVGTGGVVNSILAGADLPFYETSAFVMAMISGMLLGRVFSRKLVPWQIQRGFAMLLCFVSIYMMYRAIVSFSALTS
jgi:uncharacterized membrane protein YfcA